MNNLLNFFYRYWVTIVLITVLAMLIRQNLFINEFPYSLIKKQAIIDKNVQRNEWLKQQNQIKFLELQASLATDMEVLESQARYQFSLIKKGEHYYQISESTSTPTINHYQTKPNSTQSK